MGRVSVVARASDCHLEKSGFISLLVPLSKALYHACFICGQRFKWWSRRPKLTLSAISGIKPIIYIFLHWKITRNLKSTTDDSITDNILRVTGAITSDVTAISSAAIWWD